MSHVPTLSLTLTHNYSFLAKSINNMYNYSDIVPTQVWEAVVSGSAHQDLANALSPLIFPFLCLLVSPSSTPIDPAHLTRPSPGAQVRGIEP